MRKFKVMFVLSLAVFVMTQDRILAQEEYTLPVPPDSRLESSHDIDLGGLKGSSFVYVVPDKQENVVKYYSGEFKKDGFKQILDVTTKEGSADKRVIRFRKGDLVISLAVQPEGDGSETLAVIARYIQPEGSPDPEDRKPSTWREIVGTFSAKQDVEGEDLKFIPRPRGSIRIEYSIMDGNTAITYSAPADVEETKAFYDNQMYYNNWDKVEETSMDHILKDYRKVVPDGGGVLKMPFSDVTDFRQLMKGGYVLKYKGYWGEAEVTIIRKNPVDRQQPGSLVMIKYKR